MSQRDKATEEKAEAEARLAGDPGENAKLVPARSASSDSPPPTVAT